ncbi:hypothetical protein Btru_062175 [Bulinus truncatus]|nr:hypothetical protein Btru_062175 [Bulinus truncatus]
MLKTKAPNHLKMPQTKAPKHLTMSKTKVPKHLTMPQTNAPKHLTMPQTKAPKHLTMSQTMVPKHLTMPQTKAPKHLTMPQTKAPKHLTMPQCLKPSLLKLRNGSKPIVLTQTRENFVIATKVRFTMGTEKNANNVELSRRHITTSIDNSLSRLRTNYVDLYQTHCFDDATPLEETLRTLDDLVRCGKVRYAGVSNVTGWQLQRIIDTTEKLGLNPIASLQQQYSLASRDSELEAFQVCKAAGIGVLPWSPLKGGLLTGKVKRGVKPTEGRLGFVADNENRAMQAAPSWKTFDDQIFDVIEALQSIATKHVRSVPQVAIRWLLQRDVVSSVVLGARTLSQLDDNLAAGTGWSLNKQEMQLLDDLSKPAVPYPYDMVFKMNEDRQNQITDHYVR